MREEELEFDRKCHVIYSKECKQAILKCIASHYPEDEIDGIFTQVQQQYVSWLQNYRTDLGGKANFHNGVGGTYDCIAVFSYYEVCRQVTSFDEIEAMYAGALQCGLCSDGMPQREIGADHNTGKWDGM